MDYVKSGDPGIGRVIERREWVEGMEIRYWISDIRVGMGSNTGTKWPGKQVYASETHLRMASLLSVCPH